MATTEDAWRRVERWARAGGSSDRCILDLRARVEALEQRAATPAPEPAPAPDDRPLWGMMAAAYYETAQSPEDWAAVLDVLSAWLAAREHCGAASALRTEARRGREGA